MALPQKDVFNALLRNHNTQAKELCEQAGVSYRMLAKRISYGTLYKMGYLDITRFCFALGVSQTDFINSASGTYTPATTPRIRKSTYSQPPEHQDSRPHRAAVLLFLPLFNSLPEE